MCDRAQRTGVKSRHARHTPDASMDTQGGDKVATIRVATNHRSGARHATRDAIPDALHANHIDAAWLALARA